MFALINTFHKSVRHTGIIISRHHTEAAAENAAERHARAVRRANGRDSYVPTTIKIVPRHFRAGDLISPHVCLDPR